VPVFPDIPSVTNPAAIQDLILCSSKVLGRWLIRLWRKLSKNEVAGISVSTDWTPDKSIRE